MYRGKRQKQRKACITVQMATNKGTTSLRMHQKCTELHIKAPNDKLDLHSHFMTINNTVTTHHTK